MTAARTGSVWLAASENERDSLSAANGVAVGDLCFVQARWLYVATVVTGSGSTWQSISGPAAQGPWALTTTNPGSAGAVTAYSAVTFRAALDVAPALGDIQLAITDSLI